MTSVWTSFLLEILSAPILHKLQQICSMKTKTKEMILSTRVWESKPATFCFLRSNCSNYWVKISNSNGKNSWAWMTVHQQPVNCRVCKAYLSATVCKHKCRLDCFTPPLLPTYCVYYIKAKSPILIIWYMKITAYPGRLTLSGKHGPQKIMFPVSKFSYIHWGVEALGSLILNLGVS